MTVFNTMHSILNERRNTKSMQETLGTETRPRQQGYSVWSVSHVKKGMRDTLILLVYIFFMSFQLEVFASLLLSIW